MSTSTTEFTPSCFIPYNYKDSQYIGRSDFFNPVIRYNARNHGFEIDLSKIKPYDKNELTADEKKPNPYFTGKYIYCNCTSTGTNVFGDAAKERWFNVHLSVQDIFRFNNMPEEDKQKHEWNLLYAEKRDSEFELRLFDKK